MLAYVGRIHNLKDLQGGLMLSERKHGLSTEQVPVSAYVGSSKNLKDLKGTLSEISFQGLCSLGNWNVVDFPPERSQAF